MTRTRITISMLAAIVCLASCQKTYKCACDYRPGKLPIANTAIHDIKARTTAKAITKCDEKDTESIDCQIYN